MNNNPELLDAMSEIYDQNIDDIKSGLYGEYIETNDDGTFTVVDAIVGKTLKIVDNTVLWIKIDTETYAKWLEAIPIISIKDLRYEQDFFENRTKMSSIDEIFKSPDYFYRNKGIIATVKYMTPMEYIEKCATGFNIELERQIKQLGVKDIVKYAADMLKGDLFPMINIKYHENASIDQEGRHRAMAVQHLIDTKAIPEDTLIPVVIVTEV